MNEENRDYLEVEVFGDPGLPTLVCLPGIHGDATMFAGFRHGIAGRLRLIEFAYPTTTTWSLDDYADAVYRELEKRKVKACWLLGESFGSQVVWALIVRHAESIGVRGVFLAGGFVQHPWLGGVDGLQWVFRQMPFWAYRGIVRAFELFARVRFRRQPPILARMDEFVANRTEPDRQAVLHRLTLIRHADFREPVRALDLPIVYLTGLADPIVFWPPVYEWLRDEAQSFRRWRLFWYADHNVLNGAAAACAEEVVSGVESGLDGVED